MKNKKGLFTVTIIPIIFILLVMLFCGIKELCVTYPDTMYSVLNFFAKMSIIEPPQRMFVPTMFPLPVPSVLVV